MKKGGTWKACVFFDSESSGSGTIRRIADEDLVETLEEIASSDLSEPISEVKTCTKPLSEAQLTNLLFYHEFVVLRTPSYYWSIEKGGEGIHIQRSWHEDNVRHKFNREKRLKGSYWTVTVHRKPVRPGQTTTVRDVIKWLWRKDELNQKYNYLENNCRHLAKRAYNYIKQ